MEQGKERIGPLLTPQALEYVILDRPLILRLARGCGPLSGHSKWYLIDDIDKILKGRRTRSVTTDEDGKTSGRNDRLRGHIGVNTRALSDGWTIGPPADNEYAVDPVGVDTIRPSD
jgi:hypothetical protein